MKNFEEAYVCEKVLATRWGISAKWLQKMRYSHEGPRYHRFGRTIRYAMSDIREYEREHRIGE